MIDLAFPATDRRHGIITLVESPVHKVGGRGDWNMDCVRIILPRIRAKGVPCAVVLKEPRVWEVPEGPDGLVLRDTVAGVVMLRPVGLPIAPIILALITSCEVNWKSDYEGNENQSQEPKRAKYRNVSSSPGP